MDQHPPAHPSRFDRRALGRALSRAARAGVNDLLAGSAADTDVGARRIGITGPPGAGKSTLIAAIAAERVRSADRLAIVAIDPSSPKTRGAVLGDRIRMDDVIDDPRVFIRSFASQGAQDGLTENLAEILQVLDEFSFTEVLVETVGVGQTEYGVRDLVDVEVLVLVPGAGDHIQAMKAGILETADIYVINKADQPGAARMEAELRGVLALTTPPGDDLPPILKVQATSRDGIPALNGFIDAILARAQSPEEQDRRLRVRMRHRLQNLLLRRLAQALDGMPESAYRGSLGDLHRAVMERLGSNAGRE